MSFIGTLIRWFVERRASNTSLDDIRKELETSGETIAGRMAHAADTPDNRKRASHVIGIERWGAQRLRALLSPGAAPVLDEYDSYRPQPDLPMPAMVEAFRAARAETLSLVDSLSAMQDCRAPHNDLGPLSVRGWLFYLNNHASIESKRIK